jgi:predicted ferric reductase
MKKYKGIISILITFLLTYIFWSFEQPLKQVSVYREYSQLIASIALIALAWINYISSRHVFINKIFYGLDKSYVYHKYLSIVAILFIWVHNFTLKMGGFSGGKPSGMKGRPEGFKPPQGAESGVFGIHIQGKELGSLSMYIFTAFIIFFLIAYKLEYQRWKLLHKLMLVPYAFGVIHYYLDADYTVFSYSAYSLWMNLINAIGILSALYVIFLYEGMAFKYRYKVSSIKEVAKGTIEITGTSSDKEMDYRPGQFAFMKVQGKKKGFPSHPFTMCQAHKAGEIKFAIKDLGDHTSKLISNLIVGDTIAVSGPFGCFNYKAGEKHQIWIAGGIGITPFRSFLQSEIPTDYTIDLFYAFNNEEEGAYVEEIKAFEAKRNLRTHLFDSSKSGFLKIEDFEKQLNKDVQYDVFFCGPKAMRIKIKKDLKKGMFKVKEFHYEHFQFK